MAIDNKLALALEKYNGGPYFDADELRNYGNRAARVARMIGRKMMDTEGEQPPLPPDHLPETELCRWLAGKELSRQMNQKQITARTLSANTGLDFTAISTYVHMKRPFSCKMSSLQPLSQYLEISCNKFLTGVKSEICLPYEESALVEYIIKLPSGEQERLRDSAVARWKEYTKTHQSQLVYGLHRPINELIIDRLEILNKANGRPLSIYFGTSAADNPIFLRVVLKKCEDHVQAEEFMSIGTLIMLAFEFGYPIDWFVCEEPLLGSENPLVTYVDSDGVVTELNNPIVLDMISAYLALPADERLILFGEMSKSILGNTETKRAEEIENAKAMYRGGLAIETIAKYTQLSPELLRNVLTDEDGDT